MKVLVAYASKYGSTKGIAEFIGEKLQLRGIHADVQEVGAVDDSGVYDAFVIGSAAYMQHWLKEAKQFVSQNRSVLRSRPVWLFSSGPVGKEAKDPKGRDYKEISVPKEIDEFREMINPRDHRVFFGVLDPSRLTGPIAFGYKMVRLSKSAREVLPEGDFRDWNEIEAWATGIAQELETERPDLPNSI